MIRGIYGLPSAIRRPAPIDSTATLDSIPFAPCFGGEKGLAAERLGLLVSVMGLPVIQITLVACLSVDASPTLIQPMEQNGS